MSADEHLILCLRCQAYRPITKFRIKLVNPHLVDQALLFRPRATCLVCQRKKQREWETSHETTDGPPPGITTKACARCGEEKPLTEFYKLRTGKWGLDPRCRQCKATGEAARQRRRARMTREHRALLTYKLTVEEWEQLYEAQNGACAICGIPKPRLELSIDHNHVTGKVRGLLCPLCNTLIGFARERTIFLERAAAYLYAETHNLNALDVTATVHYELQRHSW